MSEPTAKSCKYGCGKEIVYKGKDEHAGATGFYEVDTGKEHTYARCDKLKGLIGAVHDELKQARLD